MRQIISVSQIFGGGKISTGLNSNKEEQKKLIKHDHVRGRQLILCTLVGVLMGTTPVAADVTDNLSGSLKLLLGSRQVITDESGYYSAPANAKINYLEKRIEELQEKTEILKQIIDSK